MSVPCWTSACATILVTVGCGSTPSECTDTCRDLGTTRCDGTLVQTCIREGSCSVWGTSETCVGGQACSNGACQSACTGSCQCSGTGTCVTDLCGGVTAAGECVTSTSFVACRGPAGGTPTKRTYTCSGAQTCQIVNGAATCAGMCVEGQTRCSGTSTSAGYPRIDTCSGGEWSSATCATGCHDSAVGAYCPPAGAFSSLSGSLTYEALEPNADLSDWDSTPQVYPAAGVLVLSGGVGSDDSLQSVYDAQLVDSSGGYTVQVPSSPGDYDYLFFLTAGLDEDTGDLSYCVATPGFYAGGTKEAGTDPPQPSMWIWSYPLASAGSGSLDLIVTTDNGSGAVALFEVLRASSSHAQSAFGRAGPALVVWMQPGIGWDCGACFADYPITAFSVSFPTQLWMGGDTQNQPYWATAVSAHELGHWVMYAYGTAPNEGGVHYLGVPTFPGQAWGEGWATYYSSDLRQSSIYLDKQDGTMFWVDIDAERYISGDGFTQPTAADGLLGEPPSHGIDENEVASIIWRLLRPSGTLDTGNEQAIFDAIASARLNTIPMLRGYTRHSWDLSDLGVYSNITDTSESTPALPDFLDALDCAGFNRTAISNAVRQYPYPVTAPLCL